ncbi:MAG: hypothetical protein MR355_05050 [Lachnospiraceae bacterium]|nr:hypothetical protein [Lachnospiraceae bacterium]
MRNRKEWKKRTFALLLAGAMLGTSFDLSAWTVYAAEEEVLGASGQTQATEQWSVYYSEAQVGIIPEEKLGAVAPVAGSHADYIDRVNLSTEAKGIYNQLVAALTPLEGGESGEMNPALIDPHNGTDRKVINGDIYYMLPEVQVGSAAAQEAMIEEIQTAYAAFLRDHPEVFWLSGSVSVGSSILSYSDGSKLYNVYLILRQEDASGNKLWDIRKEEYINVEDLTSAVAARDTAVSTILSGIDSNKSDDEKVSYFNQWLTKNNCYNSAPGSDQAAWECISAFSAADPDGVFAVTSPVCEGYAKAFKVLCDQAGIPCVLVSGTAKSSAEATREAHMWNYVQIDDAWYAVDVTWNDPLGFGSDDVELESHHERTDYLLVGKNTEIDTMKFAESHIERNQVMVEGHEFTGGPEIADNGYTLPAFQSVSIKKGDAVCSDTEIYETTYGANTLTFTASVKGYDGAEVTEAVTYNWAEGTTSLGAAAFFTVPANASAGNHTYTLTVTKDGTTRSCSVRVYIDKADPNITNPQTTQTASYGQTLANFPLPNVTSEQTAGSWKWEDGDTAPVGDVGIAYHNAIFTPTDTTNYKSVTVKVTFNIEKAVAMISISPEYNPSRAYNGVALTNPTSSDLALNNADYSEVKFQWYKDSVADSNKLSGPPTAVGKYRLVAYVEENAYHTSAMTYYSQDVEITSASTTEITVNSSVSKSYTDPDFLLNASNNRNLPMTYWSDNPSVATVDKTGKVTIKGAGTAYIYIDVVDTVYGGAQTQVQVHVDKAGFTVKVKDFSMVQGDELPKSFDLGVINSSLKSGDTIADIGAITYEVYKNDGETKVTDSNELVPGTYVIKGTVTGSKNYNVQCNPGRLTVYAARGTVSIDGSAVKTKVFDNQPFPHLTYTTTNTDETPQFSYRPHVSGLADEAGTFTNGMPTDEGEYVIRLQIPAKGNYSEAVTYTHVTITSFDLSLAENIEKYVVTVPGTVRTYDGTSHTLRGFTVQVTFGEEEEPYIIESNSYNITDNVWKDAGEYTANITVFGNCTGTVHANYTVDRAYGLNPPSTTMYTKYDKKNKTVADVPLSGDWSWSESTATKPLEAGGNVTATATYKGDAANYYPVQVTITTDRCTHPTETQITDTAATCTTSGIAHTECAICGITRNSGIVLQPLGHTGGTATCSAQAVCDRCHQPYGALNPSNHAHTSVRGQKAATCTENGYTGDTYCDDCGTIIARGSTILALGHTGGTATCSHQAVCDRCHQPYGALNPSNHAHTSVREQKAATCTENGYTGDTYCDDCGTIIARGSTIPALGHTGGTATCSHQAVCDRCHQPYGELNPSNHESIRVTGQKAATCTENGYTGDTVCTECGQVLSRGESIPALGHSYTSSVTKEPTTEQEGVRTYTCSRCGDTYTEKMEKLPKEMGLTDGSWKLDDGKWWYAAADGSYPSNGWTLIEGEWYAFDDSGYMQTGWYQSGNSWYYLNNSGVMQTGWVGDGGTWYYMEDSGAMATGWTQDGNDWYYMDSSGAMCTGWQQIGGIWYYLKSSGVMATGWQQIGGTWYYFSDGGAMQTSWQKIDDTWYYFKPSGAMSVGWEKIGVTWYYFEGSGVMVTGWKYLDGSWYYFYDSGAMAADTTIDGYRLSSSGAMY